MNQIPWIIKARHQSGLGQRLRILSALCLRYLQADPIRSPHLVVGNSIREMSLTGRSRRLLTMKS